jgi:hypothetical protein
MIKSFVFVKEWNCPNGTIPIGSEIRLMHGCVYFNGGLQSTVFANMFLSLIVNEERNGFKYLRPEKVIYNKC